MKRTLTKPFHDFWNDVVRMMWGDGNISKLQGITWRAVGERVDARLVWPGTVRQQWREIE